MIDKTLSQSYCQTGGLRKELIFKDRVMLTTNLCIMDRLINGQIGTVKRIYFENLIPRRIYIKFDDSKAGSLIKVMTDLRETVTLFQYKNRGNS